jgi:hypothetical protein
MKGQSEVFGEGYTSAISLVELVLFLGRDGGPGDIKVQRADEYHFRTHQDYDGDTCGDCNATDDSYCGVCGLLWRQGGWGTIEALPLSSRARL